MIKTILLLSSAILAGVINAPLSAESNKINGPLRADEITSSEVVFEIIGEKTLNLYNGESITIDSNNGAEIVKQIDGSEDSIKLVVGKQITISNGGFNYSSSASKDRFVAFELSNKYIITGLSVTTKNGGSDRTIKLTKDYSNSEPIVENTTQFKLTKNAVSTGQLVDKANPIPGGVRYYITPNGSGLQIQKIDISIAPNLEEVAKAPVITGEDKIKVGASRVLTREDILALYTAVDSIEGEVSIGIKHDTGYFMAVENKEYGEYQLTLISIDSSGNSSEKVITIVYYDDYEEFLPIIEGPTVLYKAPNMLLTLEEIETLFSAKDIENKNLEVKIDNINYLKNANKVGSYKVKVSSIDDKERTREQTLSIRVVDGMKDMWYVDPLEIHTTQYSVLSIEQLVNEYSRYKGIDVYNFEVQDDSYSDFTDVPGTYKVKCLISTGEGFSTIEFKVIVEEHSVLVEEQKKEWYEHVADFFSAIWEWICSLFN